MAAVCSKAVILLLFYSLLLAPLCFWVCVCCSTGEDLQKNLCKIVNTFLPISFSIHFGCSKKTRLIETVLLSTHNICFGSEIRKLFWCVFEMVLLSTHKISFGSEIRKLIFLYFY